MIGAYFKTGILDEIEGDLGYQRNAIGQLRSYGIAFGNILGAFNLSCAQSIQKQDKKLQGFAKK